jgi:hypothetical protein
VVLLKQVRWGHGPMRYEELSRELGCDNGGVLLRSCRRRYYKEGRAFESDPSRPRQPWHSLGMNTNPLKVLTVRVVPCTIHQGRYPWHVVEDDGLVCANAPESYATEDEARRAGEVVRREMSKQRFLRTT